MKWKLFLALVLHFGLDSYRFVHCQNANNELRRNLGCQNFQKQGIGCAYWEDDDGKIDTARTKVTTDTTELEMEREIYPDNNVAVNSEGATVKVIIDSSTIKSDAQSQEIKPPPIPGEILSLPVIVAGVFEAALIPVGSVLASTGGSDIASKLDGGPSNPKETEANGGRSDPLKGLKSLKPGGIKSNTPHKPTPNPKNPVTAKPSNKKPAGTDQKLNKDGKIENRESRNKEATTKQGEKKTSQNAAKKEEKVNRNERDDPGSPNDDNNHTPYVKGTSNSTVSAKPERKEKSNSGPGQHSGEGQNPGRDNTRSKDSKNKTKPNLPPNLKTPTLFMNWWKEILAVVGAAFTGGCGLIACRCRKKEMSNSGSGSQFSSSRRRRSVENECSRNTSPPFCTYYPDGRVTLYFRNDGQRH